MTLEGAPKNEHAPQENVFETEKYRAALSAATEAAGYRGAKEPNQDSLIVAPQHGVAGVFDGIGGHYGGAEASQNAARKIQSIVEAVQQEEDSRGIFARIEAALKEADEEIMAGGTTASVAVIKERKDGLKLYASNIGDSRAFVLRGKKLMEITLDNAMGTEGGTDTLQLRKIQRALSKVDGSSAEYIRKQLREMSRKMGIEKDMLSVLYHYRNILTNSLGNRSQQLQDFHLRTYTKKLQEGDIVILATDGMHDTLTREEIIRTVREDASAEHLVKAAQEKVRKNKPFARTSERAKDDDTTVVTITINKK